MKYALLSMFYNSNTYLECFKDALSMLKSLRELDLWHTLIRRKPKRKVDP